LPDPRIQELAKLLVHRCVGVQPGWQVIVHANPNARPLVDEICAEIGRCGAYALLRIRFENPPNAAWIAEGPRTCSGS
jgi:leucyl aminopeptidase (aminopeptidase T)